MAGWRENIDSGPVAGVPHPRLRPGVLGYRGFRVRLDAPRLRLEPPAGAVSLVLLSEGRISVGADHDRLRRYGSLLAGARDRAVLVGHTGRLDGVEVVLAPWAAYRMFGVSMAELAGTAIDLHEAPAPTAPWRAALSGRSGDWAERFAALDRVLLALWSGGRSCAPPVVVAWTELVRTGGRIPVPRLAGAVGWGERQLERRFREQIGLTPRTLGRILRLHRAVRMLAAGRSCAEVSVSCGYCDQAHLNREFRAMVGRPPRRFLLEHGPAGADRTDDQLGSLAPAVGRADVGSFQDVPVPVPAECAWAR